MKYIVKLFIVIMVAYFAVVVIGGSFVGTITKHLGGNMTIELEAGQKLEPYTVQWEPGSGNIWYLTEPMEEGYQPKKYEFKEKSNLGAMEGKITFIETR